MNHLNHNLKQITESAASLEIMIAIYRQIKNNPEKPFMQVMIDLKILPPHCDQASEPSSVTFQRMLKI